MRKQIRTSYDTAKNMYSYVENKSNYKKYKNSTLVLLFLLIPTVFFIVMLSLGYNKGTLKGDLAFYWIVCSFIICSVLYFKYILPFNYKHIESTSIWTEGKSKGEPIFVFGDVFYQNYHGEEGWWGQCYEGTSNLGLVKLGNKEATYYKKESDIFKYNLSIYESFKRSNTLD